ncbi:MAG: esterase/lipase family protein, partial [Vicinamibacteria bacterium]
NLSGSADCAMWDTMRKRLRAWGATGVQRTAGYYFNDEHCSVNVAAFGSHAAHRGPVVTLPGAQPHRDGSHTTNTPIEHLAHHLAWAIHETDSRRGRAVDVVAHSMGGLLIRYALAATERGVKDFPPYLLVEDVVTLGTPHGGARGAWFGFEAAQMQVGSDLLKALERYAWEPDGRGGTDWTTVGSDDDDAVAADRAAGTDRDRDPTSRYVGSSHKVWYTTADDIEHGDYGKRDSAAATAHAYVAPGRRPFTARPQRIVWPVRLAFTAIGSGKV